MNEVILSGLGILLALCGMTVLTSGGSRPL